MSSVPNLEAEIETADMSSLSSLPAEIIHHILSFLPPTSLALVAQTCRLLNEHSYDDKLWQAILLSNLPASNLKTAAPASSFRELYKSHFPHWFLPKHKIWFSDAKSMGKLLIARYSPSRQTIEAYTLVAERGVSTFKFWKWNPEVIIHTFDPKVQLDLNRPVLRLKPNEMQMGTYQYSETRHSNGIVSVFLLARPLAPEANLENIVVWPPLTLPATVRSSEDIFHSSGHLPTKLSEVSHHTFRLRRCLALTHRYPGIRPPFSDGEENATYGTLPAEAYTPTKLNPWRGIWCGDYSGHGCEFLAILQPDVNVELPEGARGRTLGRLDRSASAQRVQAALAPFLEEMREAEGTPATTSPLPSLNHIPAQPESETTQASIPSRNAIERPQADELEEENIYQGQILAVKLTGDPNVPRGEYTFIAPDISRNGTIRIADEETFKGARIVQSVGHIAGRYYREDTYIPSQLILISHDTIAQYWETFGHISYYRRVDIDSFLAAD